MNIFKYISTGIIEQNGPVCDTDPTKLRHSGPGRDAGSQYTPENVSVAIPSEARDPEAAVTP